MVSLITTLHVSDGIIKKNGLAPPEVAVIYSSRSGLLFSLYQLVLVSFNRMYVYRMNLIVLEGPMIFASLGSHGTTLDHLTKSTRLSLHFNTCTHIVCESIKCQQFNKYYMNFIRSMEWENWQLLISILQDVRGTKNRNKDQSCLPESFTLLSNCLRHNTLEHETLLIEHSCHKMIDIFMESFSIPKKVTYGTG